MYTDCEILVLCLRDWMKRPWYQMEGLLALIKIDLTCRGYYGSQFKNPFCKMVMYWWWDRRRKVDYGRVGLVTVHCLACFHWPWLCSESQWEDAAVKINFQGLVTSLHSPQMVTQDNIFGHLSSTFNLLLHNQGKYWMEHLAVVPGWYAAELKWSRWFLVGRDLG